MHKDYCEHCKEYKDDSFGEHYGPQDTFFTCLDCRIKDERRLAGMHSKRLEMLLKLQFMQPERLNPEGVENNASNSLNSDNT